MNTRERNGWTKHEPLRRVQRLGRALCLLGLALPAVALAADEALPAVAKAPGEPLGVGNLLQFTVSLLLVLAAIVATAWLLRRFGRLQASANGAMRVIGGLSVGPRERVILVQVGKQQLLLGVAPGRVQMLHVLDEPIVTEGEAGRRAPDNFAERLAAALRGGKAS